MSLLEEIGAILGFVAFGAVAVLAFLTFQQARHLRRLRDWAGRAPERAVVEAERVAGAAGGASASGSDARATGPSRLERVRSELAVRYEEVDRRMPFDLRILAGALVAILVGVGIATSGFGLIGSDDGASSEQATSGAEGDAGSTGVEVAVLNGTAPSEGGVGVVGIAKRISKDVSSSGYDVGEVDTASSFPASVVMFADGAKSDAKQLAADLEGLLGETEIEAVTPEIEELAGGAPLALVIGQDDGGV